MSDVAAFFDLDKTLISANSALLWAKHERQNGKIGFWAMGRAVWWHGLYALSLIDIEKAFQEAMRHYVGDAAADLDARTRAWFEAEVAPLFRPGAQPVLDEHRAAGHALALLTSSSSYAAAAAGDAWGIEHRLANEFPVDDEGKLTGDFVRPLCFGPGKVERAEAWAAEHGVDLDQSFFYTDSYTDLPMLERVGEPRVVAPDTRLRRAAKQRGWPILEW